MQFKWRLRFFPSILVVLGFKNVTETKTQNKWTINLPLI